MDNYQQLFVRACKSNNAEQRIKRLYKSIYYTEFNYNHGMYILMKIVQEYNLIRFDRFVLEYANPEKSWQYGSDSNESYDERMFKAFISIIRLSKVVKFPDYRQPAKFRKSMDAA